jgi:hypothetical protein
MVSFTMRLLQAFIVLLVLLRSSASGVVVPRQSEITEDSYFYGQSPPVYPTRTFPFPFKDLMAESFQRRCQVADHGP